MNNPIEICRSSEAIFAQTGNSISVYIIRKAEALVKSDNGVSTIQCLTPSPPALLPPRWRSLRNSLQRPSQQYIVLNSGHCCDDHSGVKIPLVLRDQYECSRQEREILQNQKTLLQLPLVQISVWFCCQHALAPRRSLRNRHSPSVAVWVSI